MSNEMDIRIDMAWMLTTLLTSVRIGSLLILNPLFSLAQIPARIKILFIVALSYVLVSGLGVPSVNVPISMSNVITSVLYELVLGAMLGFGMFTIFAAFLFGGRILDIQMGFGVASLIDPATRTSTPMIGTVLNLMAVFAFFLINGHHMMIRGLAYSLEKIPPGSVFTLPDISVLVMQFGLMFTYGVMIIAPVMITILMVDVGMAIAARTMPQVNMFIVGLPLKIFVGLTVLAMSMEYMAPLLQKMFGSIFTYWQQVIG